MMSENKSHDRFFWGMLLVLFLLALVALGVAWKRSQNVHYRAENSPKDVVYNYLLAVQRRDWEQAYQRLGAMPCKPSLDEFISDMSGFRLYTAVDIEDEMIEGDRAWVTISFHNESGPFDPYTYRETDNVTLERENGQWKIVGLPPQLGLWGRWEAPCMDDSLHD